MSTLSLVCTREARHAGFITAILHWCQSYSVPAWFFHQYRILISLPPSSIAPHPRCLSVLAESRNWRIMTTSQIIPTLHSRGGQKLSKGADNRDNEAVRIANLLPINANLVMVGRFE
jgi:hypothetical protein